MRKLCYVYAIMPIDDYKHKFGSSEMNDVRLNKARTKVLMKTFKEEPRLVGYPLYSKEQIKKILGTSEWK